MQMFSLPPITLARAKALAGILADAEEELADRNVPPRGMTIVEAYERIEVSRELRAFISEHSDPSQGNAPTQGECEQESEDSRG